MRRATPLCQQTLASPAIAWEECSCLLCGSAQHAPLLEAADRIGELRFLVVKCARCGLCFTNPRPDADSMPAFYPSSYPPHLDRAADTGYTDTGVPDWISAALAPMAEQKRLLDFGCGAGSFLRRMGALGWTVTGLDMAEAAVDGVRAAGIDAHVGTLPSPLWSEPCFEAITMWQSLEHVHEPLDVLRASLRLLTPGGKLLVTTPNFASVAARWFGPAWYGLDLPRHLTHFTPETLYLMLRQAGFADVKIWQQRRASWIRHSAEGIGCPGAIWRTRLASSLASWWGVLTRRGDELIALATNR